MIKAINIIAFDVPYPANYGGVIDVFYKIKYLHQKGIKVHLHCFEYGREEQPELNKYCESVNYYKRKTGVGAQLSKIPYIVKSRTSKRLKANLLQNDFPILFEGLHSCFLLSDVAFKDRLKVVRNHNIEHDYYEKLAVVEKNTIKRAYYKSEAKKLKLFEPILKNADFCLAISNTDLNYFNRTYPENETLLITPFHQNNKIKVKEGKGDYVLYHGNLSVAENANAAFFMINNVFSDLTIPLVIAGLNPPKTLEELVAKHSHIQLIKNPTDEKMEGLINNAQLNFLYTAQATGLKLKLLNVLYNGRFCLVNTNMVLGTSLAEACIVKDEVEEIKLTIKSCFDKELNKIDVEKRREILKRYSNEFSFQEMMKAIS